MSRSVRGEAEGTEEEDMWSREGSFLESKKSERAREQSLCKNTGVSE